MFAIENKVVGEKNMNKLNKNNVEEFLKYYNNFHDSYILSINYDVLNSKIEIIIGAEWVGESTLNEDNKYETTKTKIKIVFDNIQEYYLGEIFSWNIIMNTAIYSIEEDNNNVMYFKLSESSEDDKLFYVKCTDIEYEDMNI